MPGSEIRLIQGGGLRSLHLPYAVCKRSKVMPQSKPQDVVIGGQSSTVKVRIDMLTANILSLLSLRIWGSSRREDARRRDAAHESNIMWTIFVRIKICAVR